MEGKRTYFVAGWFVVAALVAGATGRATPRVLQSLLIIAVCGLAATFRSALERHHEEEMELLEELAETGACLASRDLPKAAASAARAASVGIELVQEVKEEAPQR